MVNIKLLINLNPQRQIAQTVITSITVQNAAMDSLKQIIMVV